MKKNFFKKLSLVLAFAMVISAFAPAGAVFAAKKPALNAPATKYVHVARNAKGKNYTFNFNIKNKPAGKNKYKWTSSKPAIATVNAKNGIVNAKKAGATNIKVVITPAKGKKVTLTTKLVVRDNITEVAIKNPIDKSIVVGSDYDFDRTVVETESGATKASATKGITRWLLADKDGKAIKSFADAGKTTFEEIGKFSVTAVSFQSKAKYNEWLEDGEYDLDHKYVTAKSEANTFEVTNEIDEVNQYDLASVDVTFKGKVDANEIQKNLKVQYMIGDVAINEQKIKSVTLDETEKIATVTVYDTFIPGGTYKVTAAGMNVKNFVAATATAEDVKVVEIVTKTATINKETDIDVELKNENGVIINKPSTAPASEALNQRLTFEHTNDAVSLVNGKVFFSKVGDSTEVTTTYHTYNYDEGVEKVIVGKGTIVGVAETTTDIKRISAWSIEEGNTVDFGKTNELIALKDAGRQLHVQLEKTDGTFTNNTVDADLFKLTSSNSNVLFVNNAGELITVREGTVSVAVEYEDKFVGSIIITVKPERKATALMIDKYTATLSNANFDHTDDNLDGNFNATETFTPEIVDQYGIKVAVTAQFDFEAQSSNPQVVAVSGGVFEANPAAAPGVSAAKAGTYRYIVSNSEYPALKRTISINVQQPNSEAVRWEAKADFPRHNGDDTKLLVGADIADKFFNVQLVGYAKNGVAVRHELLTKDQATVANNNYNVKVTDVDTKNPVELVNSADGQTFRYNTVKLNGTAVEKAATGRYIVEIRNAADKLVSRTTATVVDTQPEPELTVKGFRTYETNAVKEAFEDCFDLKLVGDADGLEEITAYNFDQTKSVEGKAYITSVTIKKTLGANTYTFDRAINYYITVPVGFNY